MPHLVALVVWESGGRGYTAEFRGGLDGGGEGLEGYAGRSLRFVVVGWVPETTDGGLLRQTKLLEFTHIFSP
jgi:hypothetical protein